MVTGSKGARSRQKTERPRCVHTRVVKDSSESKSWHRSCVHAVNMLARSRWVLPSSLSIISSFNRRIPRARKKENTPRRNQAMCPRHAASKNQSQGLNWKLALHIWVSTNSFLLAHLSPLPPLDVCSELKDETKFAQSAYYLQCFSSFKHFFNIKCTIACSLSLSLSIIWQSVISLC